MIIQLMIILASLEPFPGNFYYSSFTQKAFVEFYLYDQPHRNAILKERFGMLACWNQWRRNRWNSPSLMRNLHISQPLLSMMHPAKKIWFYIYYVVVLVSHGKIWR